MNKENAAARLDVILKLEEPDKEIFIRRYFYLEKVMDIAKEQSINAKTVSSKLARTREKLQEAIDKRGIRR